MRSVVVTLVRGKEIATTKGVAALGVAPWMRFVLNRRRYEIAEIYRPANPCPGHVDYPQPPDTNYCLERATTVYCLLHTIRCVSMDQDSMLA